MSDDNLRVFVSDVGPGAAQWDDIKARVAEFIQNDDAVFAQLRMSEVNRRHLFRLARKLAKLAVTMDDEGWRQADEMRAAEGRLEIVKKED